MELTSLRSVVCCAFAANAVFVVLFLFKRFSFCIYFWDFLVQKISGKANICQNIFYLLYVLYVKIMHYGDTTSRPQYVLQHSIQTRQDLCIDSKQAHHTLYSTSLVACLLACLSGVIATSSQAVVDCIGCCLHQQQVKSRSKRLVAYMAVCVRNG